MKRQFTSLQALPVATDAQAPAMLSAPELTRIFLAVRRTLEQVIARRTRDRHAAQDAAQDIYLRLSPLADRLPNEDEARRYLMRMAVNAAIDQRRTEARRLQILEGVLTLYQDHVPDPQDSALAQDKLGIVETALGELPAKCRDVLYLTRVEGLPREEVARRLGVSISLVNKYVLLAMKHCAKRLEEA